jgi:hypothetical protein
MGMREYAMYPTTRMARRNITTVTGLVTENRGSEYAIGSLLMATSRTAKF